MKNIAIFASGSGSNAQAIMNHFSLSEVGRIVLVVTDNKNALVLKRAVDFNVPTLIHDKEDIQNGNLLKELKSKDVDFIVLAGYLKKIQSDLTLEYPEAIVNIHPALLPKFGGQGMYGMNVHRSVVEKEETVSGITIHYVNDHYDEGTIIEQHECAIDPNDSPETVQKKVLKLEHEYFATCIEKLLI